MAQTNKGARRQSCAMLSVAAGAVLCGCAGNGEGLDASGRPIGENGPGGPVPPTTPTAFQQIQDTVFTPICAPCHSGASAPVGLRLDAANSYALLVNVPSVQVPSLMRVAPGDPQNSYLVQKIEGRASVGGRMPLGQPPLPQTSIDLVRAWIADGAVAPMNATDRSTIFRVVTTIPAPEAVETRELQALHVLFSADLDVGAIDAAGVRIQASGGDGDFENGNEIDVPVADVRVSSLNTRMLTVQPARPIGGDVFRLVMGNAGGIQLADVGAHILDGDDDGHAGGEFSMRFEVVREGVQ